MIGIEKHQVAKAIAKYDNVRGRTVTRPRDVIHQIYTEIRTGVLSEFSTEISNILNLRASTSVQRTAIVRERIIALLDGKVSGLTIREIGNDIDVDKHDMQIVLTSLTKAKVLCRYKKLGYKNRICYSYALIKYQNQSQIQSVEHET